MELERYRELLAETAAPARLREGDGKLPPELELQSAWFAGAFGRDFESTDGKKVRVVQFGHWNHAAGPDFVDAVVEIGGEPHRGAIEMDSSARDWEAHGHSENPAYDKVVLHVFFEAVAGVEFFTRTAAHHQVTQVVLDAGAIEGSDRRAEADARLGRCAAPLAEMPGESVESLLDAAARHRMARKSRAFSNYAAIHGRDEALFAGIAEAMGFRRNRLPMRVLAGRLPLRELRKAGAEAEGLLFGAAGFLDSPNFETAPDETRDYLRDLWETWWKHRGGFDPERDPHWTFAGSRPSNHPHRRLAALAEFVSRWPTWSKVAWADNFEPKAVRRFVAEIGHPYWGEHYTLASKKSARPLALVGDKRASDLLANVLFPARLPDHPELWRAYKALPAGLGNQKLDRAVARLFGAGEAAEERAKKFSDKLFRQQALLQIYDDFCMADESDCEDCPFPEQLGQWR